MGKGNSLKRKATKQGDVESKLIRSNSSNAIPASQSTQSSKDSTQGSSSQSCSSQYSRDSFNCVNCSRYRSNPGRIFYFDVCCNAFHGVCLDFDVATMDVIQLVLKACGWVCQDCRTMAKSARKPGKGKFKMNISNKRNDEVLQRLVDDVGVLSKRIQHLEAALHEMQELKKSTAIASSTNPLTELPSNNNSKTIVSQDNATMVHKVMKDVERRKSNIVVSGLRARVDVDDSTLFKSICEQHLSIRPLNVRCRRIDKTDRSSNSNGKNLSRIPAVFSSFWDLRVWQPKFLTVLVNFGFLLTMMFG